VASSNGHMKAGTLGCHVRTIECGQGGMPADRAWHPDDSLTGSTRRATRKHPGTSSLTLAGLAAPPPMPLAPTSPSCGLCELHTQPAARPQRAPAATRRGTHTQPGPPRPASRMAHSHAPGVQKAVRLGYRAANHTAETPAARTCTQLWAPREPRTALTPPLALPAFCVALGGTLATAHMHKGASPSPPSAAVGPPRSRTATCSSNDRPSHWRVHSPYTPVSPTVGTPKSGADMVTHQQPFN
jgi:hypothetical protein